MLLCRTVVGQC